MGKKKGLLNHEGNEAALNGVQDNSEFTQLTGPGQNREQRSGVYTET